MVIAEFQHGARDLLEIGGASRQAGIFLSRSQRRLRPTRRAPRRRPERPSARSARSPAQAPAEILLTARTFIDVWPSWPRRENSDIACGQRLKRTAETGAVHDRRPQQSLLNKGRIFTNSGKSAGDKTRLSPVECVPKAERSASVSIGGPMNETITLPCGVPRINSQKSRRGNRDGPQWVHLQLANRRDNAVGLRQLSLRKLAN